MDYFSTLTLIGSGIKCNVSREIFKGLTTDEIPNNIDVAWCRKHAPSIDKWLINTKETCVEEVEREYTAIQPILTQKAIRRFRMMATDCDGVFPDCMYRAIIVLAHQFNKIRTKNNTQQLDRTASKLTQVCKLYTIQIRALLYRHKRIPEVVPMNHHHLLKKYINEPSSITQEDRINIATFMGVDKLQDLDKTMAKYIKRADDTMWVLKGESF
jgi:hypothetical protein